MAETDESTPPDMPTITRVDAGLCVAVDTTEGLRGNKGVKFAIIHAQPNFFR